MAHSRKFNIPLSNFIQILCCSKALLNAHVEFFFVYIYMCMDNEIVDLREF